MPEDQEEPVQESAIKYSEGSFKIELPDCGYISVNPEYIPYKNSIINSGRFHCYMAHIQHGTATFYIEQDDSLMWKSDIKPDWVDNDLLAAIGDRIERRDQ